MFVMSCHCGRHGRCGCHGRMWSEGGPPLPVVPFLSLFKLSSSFCAFVSTPSVAAASRHLTVKWTWYEPCSSNCCYKMQVLTDESHDKVWTCDWSVLNMRADLKLNQGLTENSGWVGGMSSAWMGDANRFLPVPVFVLIKAMAWRGALRCCSESWFHHGSVVWFWFWIWASMCPAPIFAFSFLRMTFKFLQG